MFRSLVRLVRRQIGRRVASSAGGRAVAKNSPLLRGEMLEDRRVLNGLTIIMHGHESSISSWPDGIANAIEQRIAAGSPAGATTAEYTLKLLGSSPSTITGYKFYHSASDSAVDAAHATSGETIIKVDWTSQVVVGQGNAPVGNWVAQFLLDPANEYLLSGPIHLIGFSRGAAAITTLAQRLAEHGIWVDQFTTLDPHPQPTWGDARVKLWDNVRFADNYWESYAGSSVANSHNMALPQFAGGYSNPHFDVPLWYIGTIDTVGSFSDNIVTMPASTTWYNGSLGPRNRVGFYYSLIGGGDRESGAADGLYDPTKRVAVTRTGSQWGNLDSTLIVGAGPTVEHGAEIPITYRYQSVADCTVSFGYDSDRNPYDGSHDLDAVQMAATSTTGVFDNGALETYDLDSSPLAPGTYYLYAKIESAGHARYVYSAGMTTIEDSPPDAPSSVTPANGASDVSLTPTLAASAFSDADDDDCHQASQWVVATDASLQDVVWQAETGPDGDKTSVQVPSWTLSYDATYYWAVRYQDNFGKWSDWSSAANPSSFHTREAGPLAVAISLGEGQANPTSAPELHFTVTFSESVTGFAAEDVCLSGTAPGPLAIEVQGSGATYQVSVSGMTGSGTVTVRVAEGAATDASGNPSAQSSIEGCSVLYDGQRPSADLANPADGATVALSEINGRKYLDVTFHDTGGSGLDEATILDAEPELALGGTAAAGVTVDGSPQAIGSGTYRYAVSGDFGVGPVTVSLLADSCADEAGNTNLAAAEQFTVLLPAQIIDDGDANFITTGSWTAKARSGFSSDYHYSAAGSGKDVATWTFHVPPGQYLVAATWAPYFTFASNAPYTVYDGDRAIGTVKVNQRTKPSGLTSQGASWTRLNYSGNQGVFTITSGILTVKLSDAANGYVEADAVRVEQVSVNAAALSADSVGPSADLASPANGASVALAQINGQKYIDLTFSDAGGAGLNEATILDAGQEFRLVGAAAAGVTVNGSPRLVGNNTYRYQISGAFSAGLVTVEILPETFADWAGNTNLGQSHAFTVLMAPQIVNDGDAGFTTSGSWSRAIASGFRSGCRYSAAGTGSDVASWTFQVPPGQYLVAATWVQGYNRATNAPYSIYDGDQLLATVLVNQRTTPKGITDQKRSWSRLGSAGNGGVFTITSGTLTIKLSDAANGYVIADAVRVEQLSLAAIDAVLRSRD